MRRSERIRNRINSVIQAPVAEPEELLAPLADSAIPVNQEELLAPLADNAIPVNQEEGPKQPDVGVLAVHPLNVVSEVSSKYHCNWERKQSSNCKFFPQEVLSMANN